MMNSSTIEYEDYEDPDPDDPEMAAYREALKQTSTMPDCPVCKASGKVTIQVKSCPPSETDGPCDLTCYFCDGHGKVPAMAIEALEEHRKDWCSCGNSSNNLDYFVDGEHPKCHKHHYRCKDCGGITQIG